MARFDAQSALEELREEAVLPHPVKLRDMILRVKLDPATALEVNREFQEYLSNFGATQKIGAHILETLARNEPKGA